VTRTARVHFVPLPHCCFFYPQAQALFKIKEEKKWFGGEDGGEEGGEDGGEEGGEVEVRREGGDGG
jgi:hypothetical protein